MAQLQRLFLAAGFEVVTCDSVSAVRAGLAEAVPSLLVLGEIAAGGRGDLVVEVQQRARATHVPVLVLPATPPGGSASDEADAVGPADTSEAVGQGIALALRALEPAPAGAAATLMVRRLESMADKLHALDSELETFAYAVSHDVRQPLRAVDGFSKALLERYGAELDEQGRHYLQRIRAGAQRMNDLVNGLLGLSRLGSQALERQVVRLDEMAEAILSRLVAAGGRDVDARVQPGLRAHGDAQLLETALESLLDNACKFTAPRPRPEIEVAAREIDGERVFFVRDNGVGFDMAYASKLFGPFQRFHSDTEFEGLGIGLAAVQRIVHRHEGRLWAESAPDEGCTLYFTLGRETSADELPAGALPSPESRSPEDAPNGGGA